MTPYVFGVLGPAPPFTPAQRRHLSARPGLTLWPELFQPEKSAHPSFPKNLPFLPLPSACNMMYHPIVCFMDVWL